jgi:hypothetical protein
VSYTFGIVIESLVAILLLLTIGYCVILNNRLKHLRADEQSLKATISELITATEIAERAVAGLKATAQECEETLGDKLRNAERSITDMERQIRSGEIIVNRLSRIVAAARPGPGEAVPRLTPASDAKAMVAAAHAIAERTRELAVGLAA